MHKIIRYLAMNLFIETESINRELIESERYNKTYLIFDYNEPSVQYM